MSATLYISLLHLHRLSVALSLGLFVCRGLAVCLGYVWPLRTGWRVLSVVIDVVLLSAGVALWIGMAHNPLHEPWLATKLLLLPVYVVLGTYALKKARTPAGRWGSWGAALLVAAAMVLSGWTRSPLGL